MPSAAATSTSLFRPAGGRHGSTEGRCAEGAVAPGGPPLAWIVGAGEKEREGRESEEQRERMPVEQSRWIFIEDSRQCFGVCFGTVDYISDGHFSMLESKTKI
jgi:hypothetical protein